MNKNDAAEIAVLLNTQNELTRQYDAARVLGEQEQYRFLREDNRLVACLQLRSVQWYQWEVLHLSVRQDCARRGLGTQLLQEAKAEATQAGIKLLQCTIRAGNGDSERLFERAGFRKVNAFHNARSDNEVGVWQYALVPPRTET